MPIYALDDLGDALAATRELLLPVRVRQWLRLAVVVLFVGGFWANSSSFSYSFGGGDQTEFQPDVTLEPWEIAALVVGVVFVILLLALVFLVVASVMEFVFVESLRSREVRIRRHVRSRWRQGIRLALFRFGLGAVLLVTAGVLFALGVIPFLDGEPGPEAVVVLLIVVPIFLVVVLLFALVDAFTRTFVVPVMVVTDSTVLGGWRRLWPTITASPGQYAAYVVVAVVVSMVIAFVLGILTAIVALLALVPFSIPFIAGFVAVDSAPVVGIVILVVTGIVFAIVVAVGIAIVRVPFATYLRYFSLLVLGDVAPDLDPVPEVRESIRGDAEPSDE